MKNFNLKIKFNNYELIDKNYSQANQDLFVLSCLDGKTNGTFLDLGCNDPIRINNTYLLEKNYDWTGFAIDIEQKHIDSFKKIRKCKSFCFDCTKIDYEKLLNGISHIDYLSLDLEPAGITLECLKIIPFNKIDFSVITYEHDYYKFGPEYRAASRKIIQNHGYYLLCSNVTSAACLKYEDWYVNKKYVDLNKVKCFESEGKKYMDIVMV